MGQEKKKSITALRFELVTTKALVWVAERGSRCRTDRRGKDIVLAIVTLAGAMVFSLGVKEYAREVVGSRSVTDEHGILR